MNRPEVITRMVRVITHQPQLTRVSMKSWIFGALLLVGQPALGMNLSNATGDMTVAKAHALASLGDKAKDVIARLDLAEARLQETFNAVDILNDAIHRGDGSASLAYGRVCLAAGGAYVYTLAASQIVQRPPLVGTENDVLEDIARVAKDIDDLRSTFGCP